MEQLIIPRAILSGSEMLLELEGNCGLKVFDIN